MLSPQHLSWSLSRIAQVWLTPAAMAFAVRPVPRSTSGRLSPISFGPLPRSTVSPRPSCPQ
ncbi:hypothetical protein BE21_58045 [Sorangium cellulosum]|uniref:Uncharacterized protein n=1 Tax=Sorangium cellulosum TaxID=56 RepID=A0A150U2W5_SORCE|nr:hypothetical protein BE21_58045 [Sorangium cellulosum]